MNIIRIKKYFPIFTTHKNLVYLDNAATTHKPQCVIDALTAHYAERNANIHRGIYRLSEQATESYDTARAQIARFIGARDASQIIFVRNTTEAINLVAHSYLRHHAKAGDEILLTVMEHHSNIVPWQLAAKEKKLTIRYAHITKTGELDMADLKKKITPRTRLIAVTHASNVLGTINDIAAITRLAHARNIPVLVDGAQAAPHMPVNVSALGCDFYAFSGHKMYAPTGIGALYVSKKYLTTMDPFLGGGDMIRSVSLEGATFQDAPERFEAGTPAIEAAVAFGVAADYLTRIGMKNIRTHEKKLTALALKELSKIPGITIYGPTRAEKRTGVISFTSQNIHPHDLASLLDEQDIAIRAGNHCAMPLHTLLEIPATARMSFSLYTSPADIRTACRALRTIVKKLQ